MGAWTFIEPRLRELTSEEVPTIYVGKPARPSPAQGSAKFHATEHADLVRRAFGRTEVLEGDKAAVQETQERTPASRTD
jgi:2-oxoglutarate dehydrogenase E1 component